MFQQPTARPARTHRLLRTTFAVAAVAAPLGLLVDDAAAAAVPGDRQSPAVVALAGDTLAAIESPPADDHVTATVDDVSPSAFARPSSPRAYEDLLVETAAATAREVGVRPGEMRAAWLAADRPHQIALLSALTQLGAPYQSVSSDPDVGFDCSGLTSWSWAQAGVELLRSSGDQIADAADRDASTAMAGDLVQYPGHVMMSLGVAGFVIHAANHEQDVELYGLNEDRSYNYGNPIARS